MKNKKVTQNIEQAAKSLVSAYLNGASVKSIAEAIVSYEPKAAVYLALNVASWLPDLHEKWLRREIGLLINPEK